MTDADSKKEYTPDEDDTSEVEAIVCWKAFWNAALFDGIGYRIPSLGKNPVFDVVYQKETDFGTVWGQNEIDYDNLETWSVNVKKIFNELEYNKEVYNAIMKLEIPKSIMKYVYKDYLTKKNKAKLAHAKFPRHRLIPTTKGLSKDLINSVTQKLQHGFGIAGTEILLYHFGHTMVQDSIQHTARTALLIQSKPGTGKSTFYEGLFKAAEVLGYGNATLPDRNFGWYEVWSSAFGFKDDLDTTALTNILKTPGLKSGISHGKVFVEEKGNAGFTIDAPQATLTILINDFPDFYTLDSGVRDRLACVSIKNPIPEFSQEEYWTMLAIGSDLFTKLYNDEVDISRWLGTRQFEASPEFTALDYKNNIVRGTFSYLKSVLPEDKYLEIRKTMRVLDFGLMFYAIKAAMQGYGDTMLVPRQKSKKSVAHLENLLEQLMIHGNSNMEWRKSAVKLIEYDFGYIAATLSIYCTAIKMLREEDIQVYTMPEDEYITLLNYMKKVGI